MLAHDLEILQHVLKINYDARVTKHKVYILLKKTHKIYTNDKEKTTSIRYLNILLQQIKSLIQR